MTMTSWATISPMRARRARLNFPQVPITSNPLSLYASFLAFQEQHPKSGCERLIISALRNSSDDKLDGKMGDPSPLLSLSELPYTIREVSDNEPEPQPLQQQRPIPAVSGQLFMNRLPTTS